jgi:curved DNA-binding protein CbpA
VSLWDVDENKIKKSYRRVSLKVHPDKNRKNEELARQAFEMVEKAYKELMDPTFRDPYIRKHAEQVEQNKEAGWVPQKDTIDQCQKDVDRKQKVERMKKNKFDTFQSRMRDKLMQRIKKRKKPSVSMGGGDSYYYSDEEDADHDKDNAYGDGDDKEASSASDDGGDGDGTKSAIVRSKRNSRNTGRKKFRSGAF